MSIPPKLEVIVTGDFNQSGFASHFREIRHSVACVEFHELIDGPQREIDLIIVAQSRRGQFAQSDIMELIHRYPLAGKALVAGAWCEGETRSGIPLHGIVRYCLNDWGNVFDHIITDLQSMGSCNLNGPASITRSDQLVAHIEKADDFGPIQIHMQCESPDFRSTMNDFCVSRGWSTSSVVEPGKTDLAIVECSYSVEAAIRFIRNLDAASKNLPVVVICGFPRTQDRAALDGVSHRIALLGKPFDNITLESAIMRLLQNGRLNVISDVA